MLLFLLWRGLFFQTGILSSVMQIPFQISFFQGFLKVLFFSIVGIIPRIFWVLVYLQGTEDGLFISNMLFKHPSPCDYWTVPESLGVQGHVTWAESTLILVQIRFHTVGGWQPSRHKFWGSLQLHVGLQCNLTVVKAHVILDCRN